jgi:hypothetical protein
MPFNIPYFMHFPTNPHEAALNPAKEVTILPSRHAIQPSNLVFP